jgi:hypothetical protein
MKKQHAPAVKLSRVVKNFLVQEIKKKQPDPNSVQTFARMLVYDESLNPEEKSNHRAFLVAQAKRAEKVFYMFPTPENPMIGAVACIDTKTAFLETKKFLWRTMIVGFHEAQEGQEKEMLELGHGLMRLPLFAEEHEALGSVFEDYYRENESRLCFRANIVKLLPLCEFYCKTTTFRHMFVFMLDHPNSSYLRELIRFKAD